MDMAVNKSNDVIAVDNTLEVSCVSRKVGRAVVGHNHGRFVVSDAGQVSCQPVAVGC